ncbi:hypothetical protein ACMG4P_18035 [Pseudovibrio denitrificans]|uniref:immunity protein Imm33 domain-containing protein n=1 Tax=Pseudovibrio denitrificans TaxID=258256 RepID=UPI0039BF7F19
MEATLETQQKKLCSKHSAEFVSSSSTSKVGISRNVREGVLPINGLRLAPVGDTNGWYIYAGEELSSNPDFFVPLHTLHLDEWCPPIRKYLGLGPGWRFLVAGDYEDVWFDESLLKS